MDFFGYGFDWRVLASSPQAVIKDVVAPPIIFALHGYGATWCAVRMLFRPYSAYFWPLWISYTINFFKCAYRGSWEGINEPVQIPLTPGIFPKRQSKLAQAVATTITDTLLTPEDIKKRAEELVTEENIYRTLDLFIDHVLLKEFRDTTKLHRLASEIAQLSPTMLQHFVSTTIESLEHGKDTKLPAITEKIFDQVVLTTRINLDQATEMSARIMDNFLTPEKIRSGLIQLLSPQNINALEESINVHASGPYRILARIIGVKRVCYEWRGFLEKEPEEAHKLIGDLTKRFGFKHQIALQIANFDMRTMPLENIANLKKNVVRFVETFLIEHKQDILDGCRKVQDEAMSTVRNAIVRFNPDSVPPEWLANAKRSVAAFTHSYLKRELGHLVSEAIPALGVHSLIVNKIDLFTPRQLEQLVYRICKTELRALELFGLLIGALMGVIQIFLNAVTLPAPH